MVERTTDATVAVLEVMLRQPNEGRYGLELIRETGLKSGTMYPALARLEGDGWLESAWESVDPRTAGRPPRRLYRLSGVGEAAARDAVERHRSRRAARTRRHRVPRVAPRGGRA